METPGGGSHRFEPEYLGPLGDRPPAEFLSARQQTKRREQWNAVWPMAKRLLQADEHVLHVAYAQQAPSFTHSIGLGHFVFAYHQVLLVVTDQRILEVLLNFRANGPGTRLRSFPYRSLRALTLRFGRLVATPGVGGKQAWRLPIGGDRKLIGLLLPRLQPRLLPEGDGHAEPLPKWHCPSCGAVVAPAPQECTACHTHFRSTRVATILALAFPGAGLFYLGHPVLAASTLLGQTMLFLVWVAVVMGAPASGGLLPALLMGAAFYGVAKLQEIQVGRVLGARSIPEPAGRRDRALKMAMAGGALSALLTAAALPLAASARPRLEHDLDLASPDASWTVSRRPADWVSFKDDATARSQWTHAPTGAHVTAFAYPQSLLDDPEAFHRQFAERMRRQAVRTLVDDAAVPLPFHGFRYEVEVEGKNGLHVALVSYFVYDDDAHDIHHLSLAVPIGDAQAADALVQDFLRHAKFVDAVPPER